MDLIATDEFLYQLFPGTGTIGVYELDQDGAMAFIGEFGGLEPFGNDIFGTPVGMAVVYWDDEAYLWLVDFEVRAPLINKSFIREKDLAHRLGALFEVAISETAAPVTTPVTLCICCGTGA